MVKQIHLFNRIAILLIFGVGVIGNSFAQTFNYLPATEETWLLHQAVRANFQDAAGNIWVGTNAGLYKYNLYTVTNYNLSKKSNNRLLNNTVHCINEDNAGNILVGTESGLGILNPQSGELKVVTQSDETVTDIIHGQKGVNRLIAGNGKVYRLVQQEGKKELPVPELVYDGKMNGIQKAAKKIFESLSPSRQKEIIRYLSFLKTEESLNRNIERAISFLSGNGRFAGRDKPV